MNKFQRKVNRRALRAQNKSYREIEEKYPYETVVTTVESNISNFSKIVIGPNLDRYCEEIMNVKSLYKLKKEIRKEFKALNSL